MWALAWVADYPGRNDFLGVLLNTGASNNYGHWSSPEFDAATLEATSATDPAKASAAYDRAERIVRDEVPVVPWSTGRAGRCPGQGCSVRARTASASCAWRDWRGRTDAHGPRSPLPRVAADRGTPGAWPVARARPDRRGASSWTFGTPTADSTFEKGIVFSQPITIEKPIGRVEILLTFPDAIGPTVFVLPGVPSGPTATLTYTLDTSGNDHMIPNTPIVAQWRVVSAGQPAEVAPRPAAARRLRRRPVPVEDDQRRARPRPLVRGRRGVRRKGAQARCRRGPQDVPAPRRDRVRPDRLLRLRNVDDFYGAIGPGAHENVAGSAYAEIRTLLGLIPPGQINDALVAVRIPHEFVHMVFDTASKNPYHSPPRWLNEGLAVYQSEGYGSSDRGAVESAARDGSLIPLDGLTGQFPNGQDFFLAYSESVSSVDFMIRTYGPDALVKLIRSYADGRTDDEAFSAALGLDMTAFGDAWFKDVKATPEDEVRSAARAARSGAVRVDRRGAR